MSHPAVPVRVVVADDHPAMRSGIRALLESSGRIAVVAEAGSGEEALACVREHQPDVLIVDIEMGETSGVDVARRVQESGVPTRVLALSAYDDPAYVQGLMEAGASGYLTKEKPAALIVEAVVAVSRGEVRWFASPGTAVGGALTDREGEVLAELARGRSNTQIAEALHVSEHTVRNHLTNVYDKLGVQTAREAIVWVWENGFER